MESFTRYAQLELAPLLEAARSWDEAQTALAPLGAKMIKSGSGGEISSGDGHHKVKLSSVDSKLSWQKLAQRWGVWSDPTTDVALYVPRVLDGLCAAHWVRHDEQATLLHDHVQARIDRLKAERRAAMQEANREERAHRRDVGQLKADPVDIARIRRALDAMSLRRKKAIERDYNDRINALRELRTEIGDADDLDAVDPDAIAAAERSLSLKWSSQPPTPQALDGFKAVTVGQSIQYWRTNDASRRPAFVERGDRVWIDDAADDSVRAALIVAQRRYGVVAAFGDAAFLAQARRLGRELGIEIQAGGMIPTPSARERSPRRQQRHEAIRAWEAAQNTIRKKVRDARPSPTVPEIRTPADRDRTVRLGGREITFVSEKRQRIIVARVMGILAENDWDPRDYRQISGDSRSTGRDQSITENTSPPSTSASFDRRRLRDDYGFGQ